MSEICIYTECLNKDGENPIIFNLESMKESLVRRLEWGKTAVDNLELGKITLINKYPKVTYNTLIGFRTWEADVCEYQNIQGFGGIYVRDEWIEPFRICSKYTEQFMVYHSPMPSKFPDILDMVDDDEEFIVHPSRKYSNCWGLEPTYKKVDIHNIIKYKNK